MFNKQLNISGKNFKYSQEPYDPISEHYYLLV